MANVKITELTAYTNPASTDVVPIVDLVNDQTKKVTLADIFQNFPDGTAGAPSIAFDGDSNTGIYRPGADQVAISTGGTGRLFIDSSGNVGIGTTSPTGTLQINKNATNAANAGITLKSADSNESFLTLGVSTSLGKACITSSQNGTGTALPIAFTVGSSSTDERMRIDTSGNVGIGTTSPNAKLAFGESSDIAFNTSLGSTGTYGQIKAFNALASGSPATNIRFIRDVPLSGNDGAICFDTVNTERARIDSYGRLLVGTSSVRNAGNASQSTRSPLYFIEGAGANAFSLFTGVLGRADAAGPAFVFAKTRSNSTGANTIVQNGDTLGQFFFAGADGNDLDSVGASIKAEVDGTPGANDMPGRLVFSTTADGASSPTERMRITSEGYVFVDSSSSALQSIINTTGTGLKVVSTTSTADAKIECFAAVTDTRYGIVFSNSNGIVGSISTNGLATAYNTSSDYRLKENVVPLTGAADRLNQLQVHRFNFIADSDKTVDGFLAHEAQVVVPECVTGTKDEVDDDGNPVYQGIDQSKLVPLLTAALQEALAKIETLEARLTAAGI